jgi:tetratricopeptide (TPR) repeat protein
VENAKFAKSLLASALSERGIGYCKMIFDSLPPDPRWPQYRRVALEDLEKAVKLDPEQAEAYLRIAQLSLLPEGNAKRAAEALDQAVKHSKGEPPLQAKALVLRADLHKDPQKKLADLSEAVRVAPGDVGALRARGAAYSQTEKSAEALADFDQALEFEPRHVPTLEEKALLLAKMKKFDQALGVLEQVRKLDPKSVNPLVHRARVHAMKSDLPAALKELDAAHRQEPNNLAVLLLRATVYQEMKQNEKALADVEKVLALRPNLETAMRFRAALLAGEKKFDEAKAQVEELLKTEPDNAEARFQLAMIYTAEEKYDRAVQIYTQMIAKDASNWAALRGRGDALLSLGKHAEAIADYEKAYRLQPHDSGLLNNFAWVLCTSPVDKLRNGKRALELAKEACRLTDNKQAHILSTLGAAFAELGDFKNAIEWSQKAIAAGKEDQKEALAKELESYKAGKPVRELKTPEPGEKSEARKPERAKAPETAKPKAAEKAKPEANRAKPESKGPSPK